MRSSAAWLRWICSMDAHQSVSATKSRSHTVSSEFRLISPKPRSCASASRSMLKAWPARAPQPSGRMFTRCTRSCRRCASRSSAAAWDMTQCEKRTGCAGCRCVYPAMRISMCCSARPHMISSSWHSSSPASASWRRSHRRTSVATWSFRERPVCSFLPGSPMSSVRRRSLAVWMSSSLGMVWKVPASHSWRTLSSPLMMASRSAVVMMSARWMARA
mmetsp:Transcript_542/g.1973  ORF Transcript_542/g.1973 Transcript_542/m.1973 type:complete len:217 (+) Transcript_542:744-1394(+)